MVKPLLHLVLCGLLLVLACPAQCVELKAGDSVTYPAGEALEGDIIAAGSTVSIQPEVEGDVIAAANQVTVSQAVQDSVTLAGNTVTLSGAVGNDAWIAGQNVTLSAPVSDNAYIAGANVTLDQNADIGTDLMAACGNVTIRSSVGRDLRVTGGQVHIYGTVGRDVYVHADELHLLDGSLIKGNLFYETPKKASIAPGAKVEGEIKHKLPVKEKAKPVFWPRLARWALSLIAAILFGCVLIAVYPRQTQEASQTVRTSFWPALGIGVVVLIVVPIASLIAGFTVVGLPVALALLLVYLILLYAAGIHTALAIGQWILGRGREDLPKPIGSMVLGAAILSLVYLIPFVGGLAKLVALLLGLGAVLISWWRSRTRQSAAAE